MRQTENRTDVTLRREQFVNKRAATTFCFCLKTEANGKRALLISGAAKQPDQRDFVFSRRFYGNSKEPWESQKRMACRFCVQVQRMTHRKWAGRGARAKGVVRKQQRQEKRAWNTVVVHVIKVGRERFRGLLTEWIFISFSHSLEWFVLALAGLSKGIEWDLGGIVNKEKARKGKERKENELRKYKAFEEGVGREEAKLVCEEAFKRNSAVSVSPLMPSASSSLKEKTAKKKARVLENRRSNLMKERPERGSETLLSPPSQYRLTWGAWSLEPDARKTAAKSRWKKWIILMKKFPFGVCVHCERNCWLAEWKEDDENGEKRHRCPSFRVKIPRFSLWPMALDASNESEATARRASAILPNFKIRNWIICLPQISERWWWRWLRST